MTHAEQAVEAAAAPPGAGTRFARLSALAPVGLDAKACLHLQKPWVGCTHCKDACPADCLSLEDGTLQISAAACQHCGQCASACPTQALAVDGFEIRLPAKPAAAATALTCSRHTQAGADAIRVPCLGGLHINDLLATLERSPERTIRLAGDAPCAGCASAAKDAAPAQRLVAAIEPLLRSSSVPADRITVGSTPSSLPDGNSRSRSADPNRPTGPTASRRAFFSGLGRAVSDSVVRKAGRASALLDPAKFEKSPRAPIAFVRTQETRMLMETLARHFGAIPDVTVLPRITVSAACQLHGGCVRLCPTGALRMVNRDTVRELRFDAAQCIDCGACAKSCPESALQFEAPAWRVFSKGDAVLSQRGTSECTRCGDLTLNSSGDGLCANCSKASGLSRAGFAMFGRGASRHPAETGPP